MKKTIGMAAALIALLVAGWLSAGAQCRLLGTVTDSSGNGIEGVSILVTTPNLTTFKLTVKTDKKGQYGTILNDCTMPYHLRFEKEGYSAADADKKIPINDQGVVDMKLSKTSESPAKAGPAAAPAAPSSSEQAVAAFNAGVQALNAGDKPGAEAKFMQAVDKNPDLPAGWQALTQIAYEKKDWGKVIEYGQKATDLDPSLSNLYTMMAEASRQMGDKKGAAEWTAKYAEANPESPEILYNKGIDAYNKGKMKDAEAALSKVVEVKPDFANAHFWLGMAAFNQNKKGAAREHLQKYLELDPNGKEAGTAKEILPLLK
ncbi:MAG TPA: tetratricopeptide repeat protein [Thermoanaerobaculia bacterium]